jgi:hypothetical protein
MQQAIRLRAGKTLGMPLQEIKVISGANVRERPQLGAAADMKTFFHQRGKVHLEY